jgi:arabinofuranosyltransferase
VAWEIFSLVYYGALVPNTALAKLNLAVPASQIAEEGVHYFVDALAHDPVTLVAMSLGMLYAALRGGTLERALVAGTAIYLVYIVRIGGDFMSGRFFGAPLLVALCAANLSMTKREPSRNAPRHWATLMIALVVYNLAWSRAPIHSTLAFGKDYKRGAIADERAFYYQYTGLLPILVQYPELRAAKLPIPPLPKALTGRAFATKPWPRVMTSKDVGALGYRIGDKVVIDLRALADPLLARIVFRPGADGFRIGHYERGLPGGYVESRALRKNLIAQPALHQAYAAILLVVRGPLFDAARWRAIWRLNTGYFDAAFAAADADGNAILHAQ